MNRSGGIASVVVVGGGVVGWSAAAALKRQLPMLSVTIIPIDPPPNALADRLSGTLPSIFGFHGDLGLTDADTIAGARSSPRLGTRFENWARRDYTHCYGPVGEPIGATPFHQQWLRDPAAKPFDCYLLADEAALTTARSRSETGLHLTIPRYRAMMRAFAQHLGVETINGELGPVSVDGDGFIESLSLADGRSIRADLYVDATGPAARLLSALDDAFDHWDGVLIADRLMLAEGPSPSRPSLLDTNRAHPTGWCWNAASDGAMSGGFVTSSAHAPTPPAAFRDAETISFAQGRRPSPWLRNCVAIGDAAITVEPLEWTNLHLAHSAIDRLVAMMPGRDCAPIELAEYNRQSREEANRVRDFLCLHYVTGPVALGEIWRDAASVELPTTLCHTLDLFRERGRLPFNEEETFDRDSWLTVLLCQGVRPRRTDPLADLVPATEARRAMAAIAARSAAPRPFESPTFR
jgi:tryptophan halogenase